MPNFTFDEIPDSRASTMEPPSLTMRHLAAGEPNDSIVRLYAKTGTPSTLYALSGVLYRQDIQVDPDGYARYIVTVPYGPKKHETGSYDFSFDTSGATVKIKAAKQHMASYPDLGPSLANMFKSSIGVTREGEIEGADIIIPALKLTCNFRHPEGVVNLNFVKILGNATGSVNLNPFLVWAGGEMLFAGASGGDGSEKEAELSYQFIIIPNESSLTLGEITGIVKKGHHYAWIEFQDSFAAGFPTKEPSRVHIERVYDEIDFSSTFGWS